MKPLSTLGTGILSLFVCAATRADDLNPVTFHPAPKHPPVVLAADGSVARILPQPFANAEEIAAAVENSGR